MLRKVRVLVPLALVLTLGACRDFTGPDTQSEPQPSFDGTSCQGPGAGQSGNC